MSRVTRIVSTLGHLVPGTRSNRLLILIYHRVHPVPDPMFPGEVDAACFDWQLALLREHCHPLPLSEGVDGLKRGVLPPRAVAVTFDDGYADNATVALHILKKHGIAATFFIAPGFLNGGRMWNDSIIEAVRRASGDSVETGSVGLGALPLSEPDERGAAAEQIIKAVKHAPMERRATLVREFCAHIGAELPDGLMMTSEQVRGLAAAGMEIGAHTMTHPILRMLSDEAARREIRDSKVALEGIIGHAVRAFAYPNGRPGEDYTERDRGIVESLGFDYALSTRWGVASAGSDLYELPRFTPWDRKPAGWLARLLLRHRNPA
jgi:peptidoglycan/xylan/chitin deacetylase (PgdA/CDA1 family)